MSSSTNNAVQAEQEDFPSRLSGDQLAQNRMAVVRKDMIWRREKTDMDRCDELYSSQRSDIDINDPSNNSDEIPRVNKIQGVVDEYIGKALNSVPDVHLKATKKVAKETNPMKRSILVKAALDSEKAMNSYVKEILEDNEFQSEREDAIRQSGKYGVGYLFVDVDRTMNTRENREILHLMNKPFEDWTPYDAKRYKVLSNRIKVWQEDSRHVVFQRGKKKYDEDMLRVSIVREVSTNKLRVQYNNPEIKSGSYPFFINTPTSADEPTTDTTAFITTWQLEPVKVTKQMTRGDKTIEAKFNAWQMVRTKVAGDQLLEKKVFPAEQGYNQLPVVPVYIRKSSNSPYGDPIPLKLEVSERFINMMRVIMYKSAKNSLSNQGAIVLSDMLTEGDVSRLTRVLEEGGLAAIEGNVDGPMRSLEDVVVPLNNMQSGLSGAPLEAMRNEERAFQEVSSSTDKEALRRADSGAAKRAQLSAQNNVNTISFTYLGQAMKSLYNLIYENIQVTHSEIDTPVVVKEQGGDETEAMFNQEVKDTVPKMDNEGRVFADPAKVNNKNPLGLVEEEFTYRLNDTTLNMKARLKRGGELPADPVNRFNLLMMYMQAQAITPDTLREVQLPDRLKAIDDKNRLEKRKEAERQQKEKMKQQQQMIRQQQAQEQARGGGSPESRKDVMTPGDETPGPGFAGQGDEGDEDQPLPGEVGQPQAGEGMMALQSLQGAAEGSKMPLGEDPREQNT